MVKADPTDSKRPEIMAPAPAQTPTSIRRETPDPPKTWLLPSVRGWGFDCQICGKWSKYTSHAREHIKVHSEERKFACLADQGCPKRYKYSFALSKHRLRCAVVLSHNEDSKRSWAYACQVCGKEFFTGCDRNVHMAVHSDDRPHACMEDLGCFKRYKFPNTLMSHQRKCPVFAEFQNNANPQRKHQCQICGKDFGTYAEFSAHSHVELEGYSGRGLPFRCLEAKGCGRRYKYREALLGHQTRCPIFLGKTTAPVRIRKCSICGKEFGFPSHIKAHIRMHSDERLYACLEQQGCPRRYKSSSGLNVHQKVCPIVASISADLGYRCLEDQGCSQRFTRFKSLTRHRQKCRVVQLVKFGGLLGTETKIEDGAENEANIKMEEEESETESETVVKMEESESDVESESDKETKAGIKMGQESGSEMDKEEDAENKVDIKMGEESGSEKESELTLKQSGNKRKRELKLESEVKTDSEASDNDDDNTSRSSRYKLRKKAKLKVEVKPEKEVEEEVKKVKKEVKKEFKIKLEESC